MEENTNAMSPQEEKEVRSGKIFFLVFGLIIFTSVFATYYRIMIQKNYTIEAQVDCDPYEKACFVWQCDPESDVEGEACTGDPELDVWYYNLAKRSASKIPLCDPATDETCTPMLCEPEEKDCVEIFCNEENKLEQEAECNDPEKYTLENPPEEEVDESSEEEALTTDGLECAEGDAECETVSTEDLAEETLCAPDDEDCQTATPPSDSASPDINQPEVVTPE
jgi:hypothetical protein